MPPAVLFDVDGTLVDHAAAAEAAVIAWCGAEADQDGHSDEALAAEWLRLEGEHFPVYLAGDCTFVEQRRRRLAAFLTFVGESVGTAEQLDALFEGYLTHYEAAWCLFDDVLPALDSLLHAGVALAVLTNGDADQQRRKLHAVGAADYFDGVVASSELAAAKPAPAAFTLACERLGWMPVDVWYVGDNLDLDAVAAARAGLRGVWLNRRGEDRPVTGVRTVSTLRELVPILIAS